MKMRMLKRSMSVFLVIMIMNMIIPGFYFGVSMVQAAGEIEGGDIAANATNITEQSARIQLYYYGEKPAVGSKQYFKFTAGQSRTYNIRFTSDVDGDTWAWLYDTSNVTNTNEIAFSDDDNNKDFSLNYNLQAGKTYYIKAQSIYDNLGNDNAHLAGVLYIDGLLYNPDIVPPTVDSYSPSNNATDVSATANNDYAGISNTTTWNFTTVATSAPVLSASAWPGSTANTTKIYAEAGVGNKLGYKISSSSISIPDVDTIADGLTSSNYTTLADISGVNTATNKYLGVYELDGSNKIKKFRQITLTQKEITRTFASNTLPDANGANGSSLRPYIIDEASDFGWMYSEVSGGNTFSEKVIMQVADIDLTGYNWLPIGDDISGWTNVFNGTYEGNGCTISNLNYCGTSPCSGLFSMVMAGGVNDLTLNDVNLFNVGTDISNGGGSGAIAGLSFAPISNCHVIGQSSISANYYHAGGIVGWGAANISECSNAASVSSNGAAAAVGGIVGEQTGSISNCVNTGAISFYVTKGTYDDPSYKGNAGGIAGYNTQGSITYCYNAGSITVGDGIRKGGISATNYNNPGPNSAASDRNYFLNNTATDAYADYGDSESSAVSNLGASPVASNDLTNSGTFVGWDFTNTWKVLGGVNNGYPFLRKVGTVSTTSPASSVASRSATIGANVASDGSDLITTRGIEYFKSGASSYTQIADSGSGTGAYSVNLNGLDSSSTYYARAYTTNNVGTVYGDIITFTTTAPEEVNGWNQLSSNLSGGQIYALDVYDASGDIYVAYVTKIDTSYYMNVKHLVNGEWSLMGSQAVPINQNSESKFEIVLTVDNNIPYVAYPYQSSGSVKGMRVDRYINGAWEQYGGNIDVEGLTGVIDCQLVFYDGVAYAGYIEPYTSGATETCEIVIRKYNNGWVTAGSVTGMTGGVNENNFHEFAMGTDSTGLYAVYDGTYQIGGTVSQIAYLKKFDGTAWNKVADLQYEFPMQPKLVIKNGDVFYTDNSGDYPIIYKLNSTQNGWEVVGDRTIRINETYTWDYQVEIKSPSEMYFVYSGFDENDKTDSEWGSKSTGNVSKYNGTGWTVITESFINKVGLYDFFVKNGSVYVLFTDKTNEASGLKYYKYVTLPSGYTVTYDVNNATSGSAPTDATNYNSGATVSVRGNTGNLMRDGYTFAGWNLEANGSGTTYEAGTGTFTITENITLYAKWNVALDTEPVAQSTSLYFSTEAANNNINLHFTASGSATNYLVVRKTGSEPTFVPADGTSYTTGAQGDSEIIAVGVQTAVTDEAAAVGTEYYYKIYAYNGSGATINYLTTAPLSGQIKLSDGVSNGSTITSSLNREITTANAVGGSCPAAGVTVTFVGGTQANGGTNFTKMDKYTSGAGTNFYGIPEKGKSKNTYFAINSSNSNPGIYTIVLDFSGLGLTPDRWATFKLMKRNTFLDKWEVIGENGLGTIVSHQTDGVDGKFTISGLSSFSEFAGYEPAVTHTVTTASDNIATEGTLRKILADASSGDTIYFDTAQMGTDKITLSSTLTINKSINIIGPDGGVILDGDGSYRVLTVINEGTTALDVRLEKLKIQNGDDPEEWVGGIYASSGGSNTYLSIVNCVISGNEATGSDGGAGGVGGICGFDPATYIFIVNSTIAGNKGALDNGGIGGLSYGATMYVYNSVIAGNSGQYNNAYYDNSEVYSYNCLYGDTKEEIAFATDILGKVFCGTGNIFNANPKFVGADINADNPYMIFGISSCVDVASSSYFVVEENKDIRGTTRKLNKTNAAAGTIDIGAYEYKFGVDYYAPVIFNSKGGSAVANKGAIYSGKITAPVQPTLENQVFAGWYKEDSCTNAWEFGNDTVTGETTLYAKWVQALTVDLTNIVLSGTPSNYTFAGGTYSYNGLTVANEIESITVTPTGAGTITVDGTSVASGNVSEEIALTPGVEKTITVVATETGKTSKTYTIKITRQMATQATPGFSPSAGAIAFGSTVTITSTGAEHIYYTTDGTEPTTAVEGSTQEYTSPIAVNAAMTIKAIATRTHYVNSEIGSVSYTQAATANLTNIVLSGTPTNYTFAGGTYSYNGLTVANEVESITVTPTGAGTITVDGTSVASGNASEEIALTPGVEKTITVVATETGKTSKTYTIKVTRQMATQATPVFSPGAGAIAFGSMVTITSSGAEHIYYTTDGTEPATAVEGSTQEYTSPIAVNAAMTIKAIATRAHYVNGEIGSASYTQAVTASLTNIVLSGTPSNYTFAGGTYTYNGLMVANGVESITVTPTGAGTITVDGTNVESGNASEAIALTPGVEKTITVVATESGKTAKTYIIKVTRQSAKQATPGFSPTSGAIAFGSMVAITSTGAEHIYFTTDGTDPATSVGGSTQEYTAPITVNAAMTIKAVATRTNYINSEIGSASYYKQSSGGSANNNSPIPTQTPTPTPTPTQTPTPTSVPTQTPKPTQTPIPTQTPTPTPTQTPTPTPTQTPTRTRTPMPTVSQIPLPTPLPLEERLSNIKVANDALPDGSTTPEERLKDIKVGILVDGDKKEQTAIAQIAVVEDKVVVTVEVDKTAALKQLEKAKKTVTIPVTGNMDTFISKLDGEMIKTVEKKDAIVEIKTEAATYSLPAQELKIEEVAKQLGSNVNTNDIKVEIKIDKSAENVVKIVENNASKNNYALVAAPVDFNITCSAGEKTIEVSKFNSYVERTIAIPDGIDPSKITTGVVLNSDGTVTHVPTKVTIINGKYFAKINSLTNSTYSVVWHPLAFKDVENHWAMDAVNDMGSRMVVSGVGNDLYEPEKDISRAEFAAIVVRGLGLKAGTGKKTFTDVSSKEWYSQFIETAYEYKVISGYGDGKFGPNDEITREQAVAMISRAMKITGLKSDIKTSEIDNLLAEFGDSDKVSKWAKESMSECIKTNIVVGKTGKILAPRDKITRAEVAAIVRKLLQKSELI